MRILTTTVVTLLASAVLVAPGGQPRRRAALLVVRPRGSSGWEGRSEWFCRGRGGLGCREIEKMARAEVGGRYQLCAASAQPRERQQSRLQPGLP
jgi:hypothetical protein